MTEHTEVILFLFIAGLLFVGLSLSTGTNTSISKTTISCSDFDGNNRLIRGYVTFTNGSLIQKYHDGCIDNMTVEEYTCFGTSVKTQSLVCASGFYCNAGVCSRVPTATPRPTCSDSDGSNSLNRGYVNVTTGFSTLIVYDGCVNNMTVKEFVCNGTSYGNISIGCPISYYCNDGICSR